MRLLQFPYSPFAAKVRSYLAAKHLEVELFDVPYLDRRELVGLTGGVMAPVLVDGPKVVADSARITAYLDERSAPSLRGPLGVLLEQWADTVLEDPAFRLACPGLEGRIGSNDPGREVEAQAMFRLVKERRYGAGCIAAWRRDEALYTEQVLRLLEPVVLALRTRPFLQGEQYSLADAAVGGQLYMIDAALPGWLHSRLPELVRWYELVLPPATRS
jgi:glutathione S-transferase